MERVSSRLQWNLSFTFLSLDRYDCSFLHRRRTSGIGGRFFHSSYPSFIDTAFLSIASFEMLAVILSLKLWSEELRGQRILVRTDNQSNEPAINTGRSRVPFVQSCLREL